jgi:hypothetical protein
VSYLVWNDLILSQFFRSPSGAIARDLAARAVRVETAAKMNASHTPPSVRGSGPAVRTGRLRASINWALGEDAIGLYADVGTPVVYAPYLEDPDILDRPFLRPSLNAAR